MMRFRYALAVAAALGLAGCAASTASQQASLDAIASGLTATDILALQYARLPACPAAAPCADPAVKAQIKTAALATYNAVTAAQRQITAGATADMTAVTAALAAYQTLVAANTVQAAQ